MSRFERQEDNEAGIARRIKRHFQEKTLAISVFQGDPNSLLLVWADGSEYVITVEQVGGKNEQLYQKVLASIKDMGHRLNTLSTQE